MSELEPISVDGLTGVAGARDLGAVPMFNWLAIDLLRIDRGYQRDLTAQGRKTVRSIAMAFRWPRFSPVVVSPIAGGLYSIIDGQHRTTAARLLGLDQVPCQIVIADRSEQADAFVAINGNVTKMSSLSLYAARIAAGEPETLALQEACNTAGIKILRRQRTSAELAPGETASINALASLYKRHGRDLFITACQCVTETANREARGLLTGPVLRAIAEVLAANPEWRESGSRLLEAFDDIELEREVEEAQVRATRIKGTSVCEQLQARLLKQLDRLMPKTAA